MWYKYMNTRRNSSQFFTRHGRYESFKIGGLTLGCLPCFTNADVVDVVGLWETPKSWDINESMSPERLTRSHHSLEWWQVAPIRQWYVMNDAVIGSFMMCWTTGLGIQKLGCRVLWGWTFGLWTLCQASWLRHGWSCDDWRFMTPLYPKPPIRKVWNVETLWNFAISDVCVMSCSTICEKQKRVDALEEVRSGWNHIQDATDSVLLLGAQHEVHGIRQRPLRHLQLLWP